MTRLLISDIAKTLVVSALADKCTRGTILSIASEPCSIEEICRKEQIPVSTCYRKIHELEANGIVRKKDTIIAGDGKKFVRYIAMLKDATIKFSSGKFSVEVEDGVAMELVSAEAPLLVATP